ncbi:MAG: adenine deaminase [candidate division KSB1 bacterium]|nr:adenine deaminase [candidate division KSB1 bacterium]MDZ7334598.1 adenine deaminase [candidate division KSB1 bacterium]MDZ7356595.1 adenine deaminase [candidate division KSB1 bacterium]MDZ7399912.1 adenine deaminase [candidate division KSB1 bacterium]
MQLEKIIKAARGDHPVSLLLKNVNLINVVSGEIYPTNIAIDDQLIVGIDNEYEAHQVLDLSGLYAAPGFIDGHVHIESSMVTIPQFARAVVPLGTTSVIADPHEIANVLGYEGIRFMMESAKYNPLNVFFTLPSCVPSTKLETAGSQLRAFDIFPFLREKWVVGLGEMMNFPGVIQGDEEVLDKIKISAEKRIDGHAPGVTGKNLSAYIAAGITSDHESTTPEEALEKLRMGMYVMIREGTGTKNLRDLLKMVTPENSRRCIFCTDDRHPHDILEEGHINFMIKTAIDNGIDPISVIRMATLNPAEYYNLRKLGFLSPGCFADIVIIEDLKKFNIKMVLKNGQLVAENGVMLHESRFKPEVKVRGSVNIRWLEGNEFQIPAKSQRCRVIGLIKDQIVTQMLEETPKIVDGHVVSDPDRDLLRCYVIERHHASGNIGKGLVKGFGLKKGAIASSISHDSHNIVVVGVNDEDIFKAVTQINKMGGGLSVTCDGKVLDALELPIAGLMSSEPLEIVNAKLQKLNRHTKELGCSLTDPFMAISFLALPVIPKLKITDLGLVDVDQFDFVDLFI